MEKKRKNSKKKQSKRIALPSAEELEQIRLRQRITFLKTEKQKELKEIFYGLFIIFICVGLYYSLPSIETMLLHYGNFIKDIFSFVYLLLKVFASAGLVIFVICLFSYLTKIAELKDLKTEVE